LVSTYWWVPLALGISQMGPTGALTQSSSEDILSGLLLAKDSGGWVIAVLAAGGLGYMMATLQDRTFWFFCGTLFVTLLLSINAINGLLPFSNVIASSQFIRFHAFAAWLRMVLAMFGLAGIWHLLRQVKVPYVAITTATAGMVILFTLVVWPTLHVKRGFINVVNNSATSELPTAAVFLKENLRPGDFVLSEFNWESRFYFGSPHFVNQRLPSEVPGLWDLDVNFPEGTLGAAKPVLIASTMGQTQYLSTQEDYLRGRGIRYLISTNPATQSQLSGLPWLKQVYAGRVIAIYELRNFEQRFGLPIAAGAQVTDASFDAPNTYHLKFAHPVSLPTGTTTALS
jgi:hypothetical protein